MTANEIRNHFIIVMLLLSLQAFQSQFDKVMAEVSFLRLSVGTANHNQIDIILFLSGTNSANGY
jgi:hypothetical protein